VKIDGAVGKRFGSYW